ncbi:MULTISPECIES: ParB/RepB/Spo0J family partition protein [Metallibacterium]|jgi:ParB family chromosome partitioning protein|uniref:ParB/RepB/Spo0J family partition protein n=1 Tax=Metallibacterium TaxID=1218803 RepID=UPI00260FA4F5|nr:MULTISPECIES: ParB/RepB/Spo0J family partition protein [Metallibacterium]MBW8073827.1 ParB/RepB/Spo0J family partition protein [Metallibacterium scheffleri]
MAAAKKRGLGRGLDALLGQPEEPAAADGALETLAVSAIQPGKYQPRRHFDDAALDELAASIKTQGLLQPLVVRAVARGRYELIAGERRWRAAQRAGLTELPALVREVPEQTVLALALIENIQREDLSPLEEAQALQRLIEEFGLTHQQTADAVGRSRAAVSNLLRLLELPAPVRALLDARKLEMGHARALATLPDKLAVRLAEQAAAEGWSVRDLEAAARAAQTPSAAPRPAVRKARDADLAALERELSERLATRVQLKTGRGGRGTLLLHYHSLDALDGLLARLRR